MLGRSRGVLDGGRADRVRARRQTIAESGDPRVRRCSMPSAPPVPLGTERMTRPAFLARRTAGAGHLARPARPAGRGVDDDRGADRRAARHLRGPAATAGRAVGRRSPTSCRPCPASRCSAFCCRCRSSAASARARRSSCSSSTACCRSCGRPSPACTGIDRIDPRSGRGDGHDGARAAAAGRAAAGDAVDCRGHSRGRGRRRRFGDDCGRDRRRRARRVHLSRAVDGRLDRDPRRARSPPRCSRSSSTAGCCGWSGGSSPRRRRRSRRALVAVAVALAVRRCSARRRERFRRASDRSSSARRTSPSRSSSARSSRRRSSARPG